MIWLSEKLEFPSHKTATKDGVLALGGDLSIERLKLAYSNGIFPWYSEGEPIVWYTPPERMLLFPEDLKVSKSMQKIIKKNDFIITENTAFEEVIFNCKTINRKDEFGTWITDDMQQAYINLHKNGFAKSIEVWENNELVGGLYGVDLGNGVFCGESMFSKVSNVSKLAFIHLVNNCGYKFIDCQVYNDHLASLGAKEISREEFLRLL
ncbi:MULTISPECIES: leucyl/phenylalanyl-tRNA--protein transferase [Tenacibaculum]|uniref:leucyl/phenylalanyl-tRNA--protein transferase n=1 Tax=Tenacibaculum TaxID=104267 RepID=UPI001F0AF1FD|nr:MULTISPECIES: leucyl/phenylalanyl-tRNA--protein transferase [Tenacibaculum]MCH3880932.1 leucyl/phenylalanyl-tRNA--protein transferase [Tenacibaculum aquimarinum]MDO6599468.1 leucyl/phenylalanyl-tRNA--protein transferase [Tenacibaculum sp. 1_MG-2023]